MILLAATKSMLSILKQLRHALVLLAFIGGTMPVSAVDFMKDARHFLDTAGATTEQNQDYITQSNQFTAEGAFSAAELAELFLIRAIVFSRLKDNENAFESYFAALESGNLSPMLTAETYKNRGLLFYTGTAYLEAKDDFKQALAILSGNAELHYYLANSYLGLFDFENAITQYDLALDGMANNRFLAYYGKASVHFQRKQFEQSRENLGKSLELRSDFEPALNLLDELDGLNHQGVPPAIVAEQSGQNLGEIDSKQLTANQIYNQLLKQALEAKQKNGDSKPMKIKLNLSQDQIDNLTTASIPKEDKPTPKRIVIKDVLKKRPEVTLRDASPIFDLQISTEPFLITPSQKQKRLDELLTKDKTEIPKGYFLQLSSSADEKKAQNYYQQILKKHGILLAKRPYLIRPFTNIKQQLKYQLLLSGFQSYKQANSLCKFLKAQNSDCFVRQIK
ncbi:MAG: SPOR domain-containing protein [OCS116 cluster bacterium]|nr:SPOR domain-containing protein [OCS116 cluster bacterium]